LGDHMKLHWPSLGIGALAASFVASGVFFLHVDHDAQQRDMTRPSESPLSGPTADVERASSFFYHSGRWRLARLVYANRGDQPNLRTLCAHSMKTFLSFADSASDDPSMTASLRDRVLKERSEVQEILKKHPELDSPLEPYDPRVELR